MKSQPTSRLRNSDKRRFYAVLHLGGIRSPLDAVRAAIVAEHRHYLSSFGFVSASGKMLQALSATHQAKSGVIRKPTGSNA